MTRAIMNRRSNLAIDRKGPLRRRHDPAAITRLGVVLDGICRYLDPRQSAPDPKMDRRSDPTRVIQGPGLDPATVRQRFRNIVYPRAALWTEVADHGPAAFSYSAVGLEFTTGDLQLVGSDDNGQAERAA